MRITSEIAWYISDAMFRSKMKEYEEKSREVQKKVEQALLNSIPKDLLKSIQTHKNILFTGSALKVISGNRSRYIGQIVGIPFSSIVVPEESFDQISKLRDDLEEIHGAKEIDRDCLYNLVISLGSTETATSLIPAMKDFIPDYFSDDDVLDDETVKKLISKYLPESK